MKNLKKAIIDFDEDMDKFFEINLAENKKSTTKGTSSKENKSNIDNDIAQNLKGNKSIQKYQTVQELASDSTKSNLLLNSNNFLIALGESTLLRVLKRIESYQVLQSQVNLIKENLQLYKDNPKVRAQYKILVKAVEEYRNKFKMQTNKEYLEVKEKIEKDPDVKMFLKKREELFNIKSGLTKTKVRKILTSGRRLLNRYHNSVEIFDDEGFKSGDNPLYNSVKEKLYDFYGVLSDVFKNDDVVLTVDEIADMSIDDIMTHFDSLTSTVKGGLILNKIDLAKRINEIAGDNVADILFEEFDLNDENDLQLAREYFVMSKVKAVTAIANVVAKSYGVTNNEDIKDLIGQGLLVVTQQFDVWKKEQLQHDTALSTTVYITSKLWLELKKYCLSEIKLGGMVSHSSYYHAKHDLKDEFEEWLQIPGNTEISQYDINFQWQLFIEFLTSDEGKKWLYDKGMFKKLKSLANVVNIGSFRIDNQTSLNSDNTGDEGVTDRFINIIDSKSSQELNTKITYMDFMNVIQKLFSIKKVNKSGEVSNKKYFDKIDLCILMCLLGLTGNPKNGKSSMTRKEIMEYCQENGMNEITTISAVTLRIQRMFDKLNNLSHKYPAFKSFINDISLLISADSSISTSSYKELKNGMMEIYNKLEK